MTMSDDLTITVVSDTHGKTPELPPAKVLIHCGDLTTRGFRSDTLKQLVWLEQEMEKFEHGIFVPGNHDLYEDD